MSKPPFEIVQEDMGGWVRVFLGRGEPAGEVARFLSHGQTDWDAEASSPACPHGCSRQSRWRHGGASRLV